MKTLIHIVVAGTIVYVLALVFAFFWQRNMIYFPPEPAQQPFDIHLRSGNTVLGGWIVPGTDPGAIVLFGGNAMAMSNWKMRGPLPRCTGRTWILVPYRGYEGNPGSPNEHAMIEDGKAVVRWAQQRYERVSILGISLGSGVAMAVAAQEPGVIDKVLLGTPYDSMTGVARDLRPWLLPDLILRDRFDSARHANKIQVPVRVLRAEFDTLIRPARTQALIEAFGAGDVQETVAPGDHDSVWLSREACHWLERETIATAD